MNSPLEKIKRKRAECINRILQKGYMAKYRIYVGMATCEIAAGAGEVMKVFKKAIETGELKDVYLSQKGCAGRCNLEPTVEVVEAGKNPVKYGQISEEKAVEIIERHLKNNEVIKEWIVR
jgi:(2Fe-2S) ferredoxin